MGVSHQKGGGGGIFVLCTTGIGISLNGNDSTGESVWTKFRWPYTRSKCFP